MQLAIYIVRRLVYLLIALFLVSLITFVITRVLPGNPAYLIVGVQADESTVEAVTERLGLDDPIYQQYIAYGAPPEVPAKMLVWLLTEEEARARSGETFHAPRFVRDHGLLPGWPPPKKDRR